MHKVLLLCMPKLSKRRLIKNHNNDQNKASYFSLYIKIESSPIQSGRELLQLNKIGNVFGNWIFCLNSNYPPLPKNPTAPPRPPVPSPRASRPHRSRLSRKTWPRLPRPSSKNSANNQTAAILPAQPPTSPTSPTSPAAHSRTSSIRPIQIHLSKSAPTTWTFRRQIQLTPRPGNQF